MLAWVVVGLTSSRWTFSSSSPCYLSPTVARGFVSFTMQTRVTDTLDLISRQVSPSGILLMSFSSVEAQPVTKVTRVRNISTSLILPLYMVDDSEAVNYFLWNSRKNFAPADPPNPPYPPFQGRIKAVFPARGLWRARACALLFSLLGASKEAHRL